MFGKFRINKILLINERRGTMGQVRTTTRLYGVKKSTSVSHSKNSKADCAEKPNIKGQRLNVEEDSVKIQNKPK